MRYRETKYEITPPIPGTRLHQTLYVSPTLPFLSGYPEMRQGWGVFLTSEQARSGNPENVLVFYERGKDMKSFVASQRKNYKFNFDWSTREF